MTDECPLMFPRHCIPQPHGMVPATCCKHAAIRAERDAIDRPFMPRKRRFEFTCDGIPQSHPRIISCTGNRGTICTERDVNDLTCILYECSLLFTHHSIPQ